MPALIQPVIHTYTRPSQIPDAVWNTLEEHAASANIVYAGALKTRRQEEQRNRPAAPGQAWITSSVLTRNGPVVDFILSCSDGAMGGYPVFIFTTHRISSLNRDNLYPRLGPIAEALLKAVPTHRVYSVFAPDIIATTFTEIWQKLTAIAPERELYYHAAFSRLPRRAFRDRAPSNIHGMDFQLRPAVDADIPRVAALCKGFASTSDPFTLDDAGALREARLLVSQRQVWVHIVRTFDGREGIASLVACTRSTDSVAAITKVYTNPDWRKLGCAERLVRRVCRFLLLEQGKEEVVLYVAHNNPAAAGVYRRVGFQDGDSWMEIGFDQRRVKLGHW
ncbi:acyl-CoA N-acyltransferase [Schizophyllum fasciatum]